MDLPKFHETFMPILKTLQDGKELHYNELRNLVRDNYYADLPKELLEQKTKSGDILILNRIGWGKSFLKQGKFIEYPERGMVRITKKGKKLLEKEKFTLQELKSDPDWLAYQEAKKEEKENEDVNIENSTPQDMIDSGVQSIERQVKADLLEKLKEIDPYYFEKVILILLKKMGYGNFIETAKSGDGGIDGIINQDQLGVEQIFIQAKRYKEGNNISEKSIRDFISAMEGYTSKGVFVTTSSFHDKAIERAKLAHKIIILIDGKKLVDLMHEYGVGVQIKNIYEIKEVDEDFFEE